MLEEKKLKESGDRVKQYQNDGIVKKGKPEYVEFFLKNADDSIDSAKAMIESEGIKIKTNISIHGVTFDTLVSYFYLTGKLQKEFLYNFIEAKEDAAEILGKQKADELIEEYFFEKKKRGTFTYDMGEILIKTKAKTSLERAQKFRTELKKIIMKNKKS